MKVLFIRHANPDYEKDCLTELGRVQADALSEVLCQMDIKKIYSSSCGRAVETAQYTAKKLNLDIVSYDFLRELNWSPKDATRPYNDGSPWLIASDYVERNADLLDKTWKERGLFSETKTPDSVNDLGREFDEWLGSLGLKREGFYYRVENETDETVAVFCHAGIYSAIFSCVFNVPLPFALTSIPCDQTGVSVIEFCGKKGTLSAPILRMVNNLDHLKSKGIKIT